MSQKNNLRELILSFRANVRYILRRWYVLLLFGLLGAGIGYYIYTLQQKLYIAKSSVVIENLSTGPSVSVPTIPGINMGGGSGSTSLFQGENIIWLYTTRLMLESTLLSKNPLTNKILVNEFVPWDKKTREYAQKIKPGSKDFTNLQDSGIVRIMDYAVNQIKNEYLKVQAANETGSIINVEMSFPFEPFAKTYIELLVNNVNSYYINSKTEAKTKQIKELEEKFAAYDAQLKSKISQAAIQVEATPFPNPNLQSSMVAPRKTDVDVEIIRNLYSQTQFSLESAKQELTKITPIINVVDYPRLPLPVDKKKVVLFLLIGSIIAIILGILILIITKIYKDAMRN